MKTAFEERKEREIEAFVATVTDTLRMNRGFVSLFRDEVKTHEYGDLLDCFECKMNQNTHCELICTSEFKINNQETNVFEKSPDDEAWYVLTVFDDIAAPVYLCFTDYANSKYVLRELMNLYTADGV